jgi:hypothetical protein
MPWEREYVQQRQRLAILVCVGQECDPQTTVVEAVEGLQCLA